jgi:hypothetical protein
MGRNTYLVLVILISSLSFFFFSSLFYPLLNSDNAVTVLMIHDFKLPNDFYFWGQDRMGSLIPLLAQFFNKVFHLSALTSESITHYLILLTGFLAFASFLKNNWYKLIFCIIWFFPPIHMIDVTQFAFGIHYSLIAIACFLLHQINLNKAKILQQHLLFILLTLIFITAVWVSEMALVSGGVLIGIQSLIFIKENPSVKKIVLNKGVMYLFLGVIFGFLFIKQAKSFSPIHQSYSNFSDLGNILNTFKQFFESIGDMLLFKANEPFTSLYTYLVLILIGILVFNRKRLKSKPNRWFYFFLIEGFLLLFIILISSWTFENNVPRRYFTCTYISLSFALLLFIDSSQVQNSFIKKIRFYALFTVLIGGIGTLYNLKYVSPKTLKPTVQTISEFKKLGQIGIIGDYWNSYLIACADPDNIIATPHEFSYAVRKHELVDKVFLQKKLYLIKDMWMEEFPDTLSQFGRTLVKKGDEFLIGGCFVNEYKVVSTDARLP